MNHDVMWAVVLACVFFTGAFAVVGLTARLRFVARSEQRLRDANERAQTYLDTAGVILVGLDLDGRVLLINRKGCEVLGLPESEVLGRDWYGSFCAKDECCQHRDSLRHFIAGEGEDHAEYWIVSADGKLHLMAWQRSLVRDAHGNPISVLSSGEDVTERRHTERQLQFESYLLDSVSDSIIIHDGHARILYANSAAADMRGLTKQELMERHFSELVAPEYRGRTQLYRDALESGGTVTFETMHLRKDGTPILLEVHATLVEYEDQRAILSVGRDITARRHAEERIRQMAFHDPLTGLANRLLFDDRLEAAWRLAQRRAMLIGILFIDFDHFKSINDEHGHLVGDQLLARAADRIKARVRTSDTVARFGGDEFAILLTDLASIEAAEAIANDIARALLEPIDVGELTLLMPASIGVAVIDDDTKSVDELMARADAAMYSAKWAGRGSVKTDRPHATDQM